MSIALALVVGATSSLSVAQPNIGESLNASQTELTWVINAYALVFAALLLPAGIAADRFGRRRALLIGLTVFGVASGLSALATDPGWLIALRVVAGAGATLVMPVTLSVLVDGFPPERRNFAVSVWAGVTGAGALIGVLLAGVLLHLSTWNSIQITYGAAGLALVPIVLFVVPDHRNSALTIDLPGSIFSAIGFSGVVFAVIEGPDLGWAHPLTLTGFTAGGVALVLFVVTELRVRDPMLDVRLFRSRELAAGSLLVLLLSLGVFGFFLLGPQFLQVVRGYDSLGAALRLLPFALGIGPTTQLSPRITERFGARWTAGIGAGTMAAGLAIFALTADRPYWQFAIGLVVTGAGMGTALTAGTSLILAGLPGDRRTLASAVNDVTREVGGAVGAALFGSLLVSIYGDRIASRLQHLPQPAAEAARKGITGAFAVAARVPHATQLVDEAKSAFTDGFQGSMLLGAGLLLLTAILVGLLLPARAGRSASAEDTARDHAGNDRGAHDVARRGDRSPLRRGRRVPMHRM